MKSTDNAGNVESFSSRTFVYDASAPTAPTLGFSAFTNASATGQTVYFRSGAAGGFTANASASDPDSGISGYAFPALGSGSSGSRERRDLRLQLQRKRSQPGRAEQRQRLETTPACTSARASPSRPTGLLPITSIACDGGSCAGDSYASPSESLCPQTTAARVCGASLHNRRLRPEPDKRHGVRRLRSPSAPRPPSGSAPTTPSAIEEAVGSQLVQIDDTTPSAPALTFFREPGEPEAAHLGNDHLLQPPGREQRHLQRRRNGTTRGQASTKSASRAFTGMTGGGDDLEPLRGNVFLDGIERRVRSQSVASVNHAGLSTSSSFTVTHTAPPAPAP